MIFGCPDVTSWNASWIFILVAAATVLGLGGLGLSLARSRGALPFGAVSVLLGLALLGGGVFYTARGYGEAAELARFSPRVSDRDFEMQKDSVRMISRRCLYDGVATGLTPIVCGVITCVVGLRLRRRRGTEAP